MNHNRYTKERIKARLFSRIAALWDIRSIDALDPVVKLLVESLASEVFRLSGEIEGIEDRVVEKLARAFTPAHTMSASPAHAVVHARAVSDTCRIDSATEFAYKSPHFIQKHNLRKLAFTPVLRTTIFHGDVAGLVADGRYCDVTARGGKDPVANSLRRDPVFNHTAWIGVEVGREVRQLRALSFYFEFPLLDDSEAYLRLLGHGRWSHNGQEIASVSGFRQADGQAAEEGDGALFGNSGQNEEIANKYKDRFVTLCDDLDAKALHPAVFPPELIPLFDADFVGGLQRELVWLKVVFPPAFDTHALSLLSVHTNCFPAANVYRKEALSTVTQLSSIVPLEKEPNEYFLFVDSVTDSHNRPYIQVRSHQDDESTGTYMVRYGGAERFDPVNARDFLERLLDIYREESIAFSNIDIDVPATSENLLAYLGDFDRKLHAYQGNHEHTSYLVLGDAVTERTNLTVRYNVTNGPIGNDIHQAELFEVPEVSDIDPSSPVLMTTTRGGRKSPPESSRKDLYQYLLMSRDRIYTQADMRLFCRAYYGDCFEEVDVESGYEVSPEPRQGIIRTTNIVLRGTAGKTQAELGILKRDILAGLSQRSPEGINYRIILK